MIGTPDLEAVRALTAADLRARIFTFWEVCADAFIMGFQSEGNWTCGEVETLCDLLAGFVDDETMDDLRRAHAAWPETRNAGDTDCEDQHHQLWVNEHGTCDDCDLEPEEEEASS